MHRQSSHPQRQRINNATICEHHEQPSVVVVVVDETFSAHNSQINYHDMHPTINSTISTYPPPISTQVALHCTDDSTR